MKHATGRTATPQNADVQRVQLPNGKQAPLLVADLMEGIEMAIVSQNVLAKLIALLPTANLSGIVQEFALKIEQFRHEVRKGKGTIEDFAMLLREELEFHESINLIKNFILEKDAAEPASTTRPEQAPEIYSE